MHLSLAFPGVDPQDPHGESPGTRGEWYIFDNFLRRAGWGHCLVLETNASDPRDAPPGFDRHWSAVHGFQNPGWTACRHLYSISWIWCTFVLDFIMPLYKAWDVLRKKRKSVIADSFDEFVVKGELNSISSDFVVSEHTGGFGVTFMPYSGPGHLVGFCFIVKTNPRGWTPGKANDKCIIQYL